MTKRLFSAKDVCLVNPQTGDATLDTVTYILENPYLRVYPRVLGKRTLADLKTMKEAALSTEPGTAQMLSCALMEVKAYQDNAAAIVKNKTKVLAAEPHVVKARSALTSAAGASDCVARCGFVKEAIKALPLVTTALPEVYYSTFKKSIKDGIKDAVEAIEGKKGNLPCLVFFLETPG